MQILIFISEIQSHEIKVNQKQKIVNLEQL